MEPKFMTFLTCSLERGKWVDLQPAYYTSEKGFLFSNYLSVLEATFGQAVIHLLDMSYNEHKITFVKGAVVAIAPGLLRFDAEQVVETKVARGTP